MNLLLNDKIYNILKWVAQLLLPALGALYFALSTIWGLPYGEQVVGTITAIDAFLGAILGVSTAAFNKTGKDGTLKIDMINAEKDGLVLQVNKPLEELKNKNTITLNVSQK